MVGFGPVAFLTQPVRQVLGAGTAEAIDDAGLSGAARQEIHDPFEALLARQNGQVEVGPVKTLLKKALLVDGQLRQDVALDGRIGRGRQGDQRHAGKQRAELAEFGVFGPEVVAPETDTMRFVDGNERHLPRRQPDSRAPRKQPLGADVEQFEGAGRDLRVHLVGVGRVLGAVEEGGGHAVGLQGLDLILHQCDQGRDHQCEPFPAEGRDLETQRLPTARGHEHQRVLSLHDVGDDLFLNGVEAFVAEDAVENFKRAGEHGRHDTGKRRPRLRRFSFLC